MDKRIGAQLFTIRDHLRTIEDFEASCKKLKDMGYKIVQISGVGLSAQEMRPILDKYDLKAVSTHRRFDDFKNNPDEVIEYNKVLGSDICGVGCMPDAMIGNRENLIQFIKDNNRICAELKKEGLQFGYHNHAFEFGKIDGKTMFDIILEESDPELFNFIVDVYWLQLGGKNPVEVIRMLGKRAKVIHFKDCGMDFDKRTVPVMREVGSGNLDWDGIIAACEEAGSEWAIVEQDGNWVNDDAFESLKQSYSFLKTKGFC